MATAIEVNSPEVCQLEPLSRLNERVPDPPLAVIVIEPVLSPLHPNIFVLVTSSITIDISLIITVESAVQPISSRITNEYVPSVRSLKTGLHSNVKPPSLEYSIVPVPPDAEISISPL